MDQCPQAVLVPGRLPNDGPHILAVGKPQPSPQGIGKQLGGQRRRDLLPITKKQLLVLPDVLERLVVGRLPAGIDGGTDAIIARGGS